MTTDRPWDRAKVITELRRDIWRHLSRASTAHDVELDAAPLLDVGNADLARLADLHFVLDPTQRALLDACPTILRRLSTTTTPTTEIAHDRVRGPVDWVSTTRTRALTRTRLVVTRPQVRDGDVQPNRMLALLLAELRDRARASGLETSGGEGPTLAARVTDIGRRASAFAAHRALRGVTPLSPTARDLTAADSARVRRRYPGLVDAVRSYEELVVRRDAPAVRTAVERYGFAVASDGTLFEILVLLRLRDALRDLGFTMKPLTLFDGGLTFAAQRDQVTVTAWYQRLPRSWRAGSRYPAALRAHGLSDPHDLRPDLVLRVESVDRADRWVVVEAKTTISGRPVPVLVRRALTDLLGYRASFHSVLDAQSKWGLGVVWGAGLRGADHEVQICTPDLLQDAVASLLTP